MKKMLKIVFVVFLFIAIKEQVYASATSMGHAITVGTDYGLDALRNPALLQKISDRKTISLYTQYTPLYMDNSTIEPDDFTATNENMDYSINDYYSSALYVGYNHKFRDFTLAFGLGSGGMSQFVFEKSESENSSLRAGFTETTNGETEKIEFNPDFRTSIGFALTGRDYIGFQITTGYNYTNETETESFSSTNGNWSNKEITRKTDIVLFAANIGYLHRFDAFEFGVLLRSGKFNLEKQSMEYNYSSNFNPNSDGDTDASWELLYTSSPSIACGLYSEFIHGIAFLVELDFYFPIRYTRSEIVYAEGIGSTVKLDYDYIVRMSGSLRGGFQIPVTFRTFLSIGGGLVIGQWRKTNDQVSYSNSISSRIYYATLGVDYRFTRKTAFFGGFQYARTIITSDISTATIIVDAETDIHSSNFFFGVSTTL